MQNITSVKIYGAFIGVTLLTIIVLCVRASLEDEKRCKSDVWSENQLYPCDQLYSVQNFCYAAFTAITYCGGLFAAVPAWGISWETIYIAAVGAALTVYGLLMGRTFGQKIQISSDGLAIHSSRGHIRHIPWSEIAEAGEVSATWRKPRADYIYFSTRELTEYERLYVGRCFFGVHMKGVLFAVCYGKPERIRALQSIYDGYKRPVVWICDGKVNWLDSDVYKAAKRNIDRQNLTADLGILGLLLSSGLVVAHWSGNSGSGVAIAALIICIVSIPVILKYCFTLSGSR